MIRLISILLLVFLFHGTAAALSANEWLKLSREGQGAYIFGVLDAWATDAHFCEKTPTASWCEHNRFMYQPITSCVDKLPTNQIWAMVNKNVQDNPAEWDTSMLGYVFVGLKQACEKRK